MPVLSKATYEINMLETLAEGHSAVHRLSPLTKLAITVLYIVLVVSFDRYDLSGLLPFVFYPVLLMALADIPYKPLLKRLAVAAPFVIFAGLANVFWDRETALYLLGIPVSYGWLSFFTITLKMALTVMAVLILIATTPLPLLAKQLRTLKIPNVMVLILTMVYRYISVLIAETLAMVTAYKLRCPGQKGIRMGDMGPFLGQLILRSADRAERVYLAMKCRGFSGQYEYLTLPAPPRQELLAAVTVAALLLGCRLVNVSLLVGQWLG